MKIYDVLYIGNYTKDTIISPAGTKYVDGGAVNYAAHAAARLGGKVGCSYPSVQEDVRVVQKFTDAGIDCYRTYTPSSTLMKLEYPTTNPDIRTLSVAGTGGTHHCRMKSNSLSAKAAVIGSSLRGEVGLDVIRALKTKACSSQPTCRALCASCAVGT